MWRYQPTYLRYVPCEYSPVNRYLEGDAIRSYVGAVVAVGFGRSPSLRVVRLDGALVLDHSSSELWLVSFRFLWLYRYRERTPNRVQHWASNV